MKETVINQLVDHIITAVTQMVVTKIEGTPMLQEGIANQVGEQQKVLGFSNFMSWTKTEAFDKKLWEWTTNYITGKTFIDRVLQMIEDNQLSMEVLKQTIGGVMDERVEKKIHTHIEFFKQTMIEDVCESDALKSTFDNMFSNADIEGEVDDAVSDWFRHNSIETSDVNGLEDKIREVVSEMGGSDTNLSSVVAQHNERITELERISEIQRRDLDEVSSKLNVLIRAIKEQSSNLTTIATQLS